MDTLTLDDREISINDISEIIYHPRVMSRRKISYSFATLILENNEALDVMHFPVYALRKIKKVNRNVKIKFNKFVWFLILCPAVVCAVMGFLFG